MKNLCLSAFVCLLCLMTFQKGTSQTIEMSMVADSTTTVKLDFSRFWNSSNGPSILSGNYNLRYKQVVNRKINFVGKVALQHFNFDFADADNSVSNVYLGIQYKPDHGERTLSALNAGIYLPIASEEATAGAFLNFFDLPQYIHEYTTLHISYNSFIHYESGFRLGYELGSDIVVPVGENDEDIDVLGRYGLNLMYKLNSGVYFQSELLGLAILTNDGEGFDDSSFHTYALGGGYQGEEFLVGLYYKNYFDDLFSSDLKGIFVFDFNIYL